MGLGAPKLSGRMRVPRPAARIMAFSGVFISSLEQWRLESLQKTQFRVNNDNLFGRQMRQNFVSLTGEVPVILFFMAIMLAIEQSTDTPSVALLRGFDVLAERKWTSKPRARTELFEEVSALLNELGKRLDDVEVYVVGLGPGSYTGMRIALSSAMAFALPGRDLVYGVGSAAALAGSVMRERGCDRGAVVGDARRGHLWLAAASMIHPPAADCVCSLVRPEELRALCPSGSVCVTSEWEKIGPILDRELGDSAEVIRKSRVPSASMLGRAAAARMERGVPSEKLVPLYMHQAVVGPQSSA